MNMKLGLRLRLALSLIFTPESFYEFMVLQRMRATSDLHAALNRERRRKLMQRGKSMAK
jgi:hypothetical protein